MKDDFSWREAIIIVLFLFAVYQFNSYVNIPLAECERSLPRDQTCKLIAVPDSGE